MKDPQIGDRIDFIPACFVRGIDNKRFELPQRLHGTVIHVNEEHRHYTVEARLWDYAIRESFRF